MSNIVNIDSNVRLADGFASVYDGSKTDIYFNILTSNSQNINSIVEGNNIREFIKILIPKIKKKNYINIRKRVNVNIGGMKGESVDVEEDE